MSKDYLKKYFDGGIGDKEKKKKLKNKKKPSRMKIIDEDAEVPCEALTKTVSRAAEHDDEIAEIAEEVEENPVVVFVDGTRADELQMIGKFKVSNWKNLDDDDEPSTSVGGKFNEGKEKITKRNKKTSEEKDFSPPRRRKNSDSSPPRRKRQDSESPPPRRKKRNDSDDDASPPRRKRADSSDGDVSPVRKRKNSSDDPSPPRKRGRHDSGDVSPPRRRQHSSSEGDASPLRKHQISFDIKMRNKNKKVEKEEEEDTSGRFAKTIVRKKQIPDRKKKPEPTEEEKKRQQELQEKYKVWNKGVKQVKEREEKIQEMSRVVAQPLARYEGDDDLEAHLKDQMLKDDPMYEYIHSKRVQEGKIVQSRPLYTGLPAPPNRYGILPGYRWDGVDRSNGFEKTLLAQKNLRKADEEEFYQWVSGRYE